jgi:hypothetical protein
MGIGPRAASIKGLERLFLEGDTLTICLNRLGNDQRPTEFTANESRFVWVFKKQKP